MSLARPVLAPTLPSMRRALPRVLRFAGRDPRRFGRGQTFVLDDEIDEARAAPSLSDEARLFAATFASGFLFVTLFIA